MCNDPDVDIEWSIDYEVLLSEKDKVHPLLKNIKIEF